MILAALSPLCLAAGDKKAPKQSKEAVKDLDTAVKLLNAGQVDRGVQALEAIVAAYPEDPMAEKAKAFLLDFGVGKEVRIVLDDRKVFRGTFKLPDKDVLKLSEDVLKEVRGQYKGTEPFFEKAKLVVQFYDSDARYKKVTGLITTSGHFEISSMDYRKLTLAGKIVWYFPKEAKTLKDRQTTMRSRLCHEVAHYLNAVHFAALSPPIINEGIACYFQSRLNTEYYQYYRTTDREEIEGNARNGLNAIAKYDDFAKMLQGTRGFGRGDLMISRWYGLCYAVVDFIDQGQLNSKKASIEQLLGWLKSYSETVVQESGVQSGGDESRSQLLSGGGREVLERIVQSFYGASLQDFHAALVKHIMTKYKQR